MKSALIVGAVRIGVTVLPFARLRALLRRLEARPAAARPGAAPAPDELAWAVSRVSEYVPGATCLVQAMALELLLARAGYTAEVQIGVAREDGQLMAHAWVETEGRRLLEDAAPTAYATLPADWRR